MEVENGQLMQTDLATPRACQEEPQSSAQARDPEAVFSWSEEKLLELATSLPAMRTHQTPAAGPEAKDVYNTHQAEVAAARLPARDRWQMAPGILRLLVSAHSWVLGTALSVESVGSKCAWARCVQVLRAEQALRWSQLGCSVRFKVSGSRGLCFKV